jgi:hypothetical protein
LAKNSVGSEQEEDAIFTINQILEKKREQNLPTYLLFVDYEKFMIV